MWYEPVITGTWPEEGDCKLRKLLTPIYQTQDYHISDNDVNTVVSLFTFLFRNRF